MSEIIDFSKLLLVVANLCNLQFFVKEICADDFDGSTNAIFAEN